VFRSNPLLAVEFQLDADGRAESLDLPRARHAARLRARRRRTEATRAGRAPALHRGPEFEARLAALGPCRLRWNLRLVNCGIRGTNTVLFDARGRFRDETDLSPFALSTTSSDGARVIAESSLEKTQRAHGPRIATPASPAPRSPSTATGRSTSTRSAC
jgi:hypothetical protein